MDIHKVKENLNKTVLYKKQKYILKACILRLNDNLEFYYQAELSELHANSVTICRLEDVTEFFVETD